MFSIFKNMRKNNNKEQKLNKNIIMLESELNMHIIGQ
jgi:hypothetical protein